MTAEGAAASELHTRLRRHAEAVASFLVIGRRVPAVAAGRSRAEGKWTPVQEALHLALTYREFTAVFEGAPEFSLLVPADQATRAFAGSKSWIHPYFGPLSLAELLALLTEHAHHHARFLAQAAATE